MYNDDTELLFPSRVISTLRDLRGPEWAKLVKKIEKTEEDSLEHLAFVFMMVKLNGCATCNPDSFRAMRGCTECAHQAVKRFRGDDAELLEMYDKALVEMEKHLQSLQKNK
jgi:hypothetical protein